MLYRPQSGVGSTLIHPLSPGLADALLLIARVLMGYIFVVSGWGKLMGFAGFVASMEQRGVPYALAVVGPVVEFLGGLALVFGVATPYAVLALIAFMFVATGISHRFWEYAEPARRAQLINFEKNIAMTGGLLALFVAGPGSFSVDHLFTRRKSS